MASGMTWFDTAEVYGTKQFGAEDSEALLGRFIREHGGAERAVVATKFAALPWRFGPSSVVSACKGSLERLGVDQLDLYQLHWPGLWGNVGYIDGLAACVNEGLTKSVGVSNYSAQRVREAHAQLAKQGVPLASNQVQYNIVSTCGRRAGRSGGLTKNSSIGRRKPTGSWTRAGTSAWPSWPTVPSRRACSPASTTRPTARPAPER